MENKQNNNQNVSRKELMTINQQLEEKVAELTAQLQAAATTAARPVSKGKAQAEAAFALLQSGPVTLDQLKAINEKYPNDPIYFVRTILKHEVKTNRVKGGKTTYSLKVAEVVVAPAPEAPEAPAPTEQVPEVTPEVTEGAPEPAVA